MPRDTRGRVSYGICHGAHGVSYGIYEKRKKAQKCLMSIFLRHAEVAHLEKKTKGTVKARNGGEALGVADVVCCTIFNARIWNLSPSMDLSCALGVRK